MKNVIKIDRDNKVSVFHLTGEIALETVAQQVGGQVYDGNIPKSDFLIWREGKIVADKGAELQQAQTRKTQQLNEACQASIEAGFISEALGTPHFYPSQKDDQLNLIGMATAAYLNNEVNLLKCREISTKKMHRDLHMPEQLKKLLNDAQDFKMVRFMHYDTLIAQVKAAPTVKAVETIQWHEPTKTQAKAYLEGLKALLKAKK